MYTFYPPSFFFLKGEDFGENRTGLSSGGDGHGLELGLLLR